jgi:hypothetical protein
MFSMKNAALVGLAAADRTLFTPVTSPYGQVASPYGQAVAYDPAVAGAYAMSADAFAQPMEYVQPVEFVQEQGSDSQTWVLGLGALALVGAAAARATQAPSSVASLDEVDIETAQRVATLGVGGAGKKSQADAGGLLGFLMSGRRGADGKADGSLELLSGLTRKGSDNPEVLNNRFKINYDTRERAKAGSKRSVNKKTAGPVTWRSQKKDTNLYP